MLNSDMLEVAVGLVFVYLLFAFVATAAREVIEGLLKDRGAFLERGILSLMSEPHGHDSGGMAPAALAVSSAPDANAMSQGLARATQPQSLMRAETLIEQIYRSAPIHGLFRGTYVPPSARKDLAWAIRRKFTQRLPSYIPSEQFAEGLLAVVMRYANPKAGGALGSLDRLRLAVEGVPNAQVRSVVRTAIQLSGGDPDLMRKHIQDWYDGAMDRVSGQYRRHTQWMVLLSSVAVAIVLNVNTIVIVQTLATNDALRSAVARSAELGAANKANSGQDVAQVQATADAAAADAAKARTEADAAATVAGGEAIAATKEAAAVQKTQAATAAADTAKAAKTGQDALLKTQLSSIRDSGLPIGWGGDTTRLISTATFTGPSIALPHWRIYPVGGLIVGLGWLMTGLAISLGAPFWFDVLNRFMIVRATVKPQEKSVDVGSKDKSPPNPAAEPTQQPAAALTSGGRSASSEDDHLEIASLDPNDRPREGDLDPNAPEIK